MYYDDELNLTAQPARQIRTAARRTTRRHRQQSPGIAEEDLRRIAGIACAFGVIFLTIIGISAKPKPVPKEAPASSPAATITAHERDEHARFQVPAAPTQLPQAPQPPMPASQANQAPQHSTPTNMQGRNFAGGVFKNTRPYLPEGWEIGVFMADEPLFEYPDTRSRTFGHIPAGATTIYRSQTVSSSCWHIVVSPNADRWGYGCFVIRENGQSPRWPAPAGWERAVFQSSVSLALAFSSGELRPGTDILMHSTGNGDWFFVIAYDGQTWGLARLTLPARPESASAFRDPLHETRF